DPLGGGRGPGISSGGPMATVFKARRAALALIAVVLAAALPAWPRSARAATLPSGFSESFPAQGLALPTAMAQAPDGRIFICEQGGTVRVVKNGALLVTPFLSLSVDSTGERGLLGIAFDPNFSTNQ